MAGPRLRQPLVQLQHPLDEVHHLIVAGDVFGVVEVDGADGDDAKKFVLRLFHFAAFRADHLNRSIE